uniref:RNase H type-1 domain-containing protein n=1 Tax=Oryza meridionalis TaxID=40149 RepID=A0A0E0DXY4_9ORYZ
MAVLKLLTEYVIDKNCLVGLQMIQSKEKEMSGLAYLVREIVDLLAGNREILLRKIHRDQNLVSHTLANRGRSDGLSSTWCGNNCSFISKFVRDDLIPE